MSETSKRTLGGTQLHALLPGLTVLAAVLALWLAWNGWQQWQADRALRAVETARDQAVQGVSKALRDALDRMGRQLASPAARDALANGNLPAAAEALGQGWPEAERIDVVDASLDADYAQLPQSGFGRLAVAEAALAAGKPTARVTRSEGALRLLVAAPARSPGRDDAVAIAQLPAAALVKALESADPGTAGYLALRQGNASIRERGAAALADSAEALAVDIPQTGLRVSAAVPVRPEPWLGLGAYPALIAAGVLAMLAALLVAARRRGLLLGQGPVSADTSPTLQEAVLQAPSSPETKSRKRKHEPIMPEPTPTPAVGIDPGIFRAYDIRGVVGQTLDRGVAEHIGQAVGTVMEEKGLQEIVVGRDGRLSGPDLIAGLIDGLRKAGRNVIDIGMAPTPVVYFGSYFLRTGCSIAVTGSHNPPDYNGFKIVVGGETLSGDTITDLYERIAQGRLHNAPVPGTASERTIEQDYVTRIADDVQLLRPLKVVVDAGNGVAGGIGPRVLEAIGATVIPLFCEIDGNFPNHHPDPSEPHNLEDLIRTVQAEDADLGVAFDGDGDRLGVVTRDGENIFPDRLLMLFAEDVLERNPGAQIIYDVKCTGHLAGHILRHGGSPLMWKTGHSLIKAKMRETDAALAGEMSGHFFFAERWYGFDDGIYSAARLLEILAARSESPTEVLKALPAGVSTPEIKIDAPGGDPHAFVERFRQQATFEGGRATTIDGLRVDWPDGWGLIRASNTTPVLVLRFDADNEQALQRIKDDFREQLHAVDAGLPILF